MTTVVRQCFRCDLRFATTAELADHLVVDHAVDPMAVHAASEPAATGTMVVPVSPQLPAGAELQAAATIAEQAGLAIELVAVDDAALGAFALDRFLEETARRVEVAHGRTAEMTRLDRGADDDVAGAIVRHLAETRPVLACMGTRARGTIGERLFGSVSSAVVRRAEVPVLLVRPDTRPLATVRRVVTAVDGSSFAEAAATRAAELAERLGARLTIVEVLDRAPEGDVVESAYVNRLARRFADRSVEVDFDVLHGDPARAIVDHTSDDNGTIVAMGTHGRTGIARLVAGSVTHGVVRGATCPVLVVPPLLAGVVPADS